MKTHTFTRNTGFTLLEMLVTVVIIGIVSALAVTPMNKFMTHTRMNGAVSTIKMQILLAKNRSIMNTAVHTGVHFDNVNRQTRVFFDSDNPAAYTWTAADPNYQLPEKLPDGITITGFAGLSNATTGKCIIFRGDGSARLGGRIILASEFETDTIDILASTGRVKVISH